MSDPLSEKICAFLSEKQVSGKTFAEKLGVSPTTVSRWCGGLSNPTPKMRERIEAVLSGESPEFGATARPRSAKDETLPALPLAMSDFSALRRGGMIYVDKTDLVYELAKDFGFYFLNRPRRFLSRPSSRSFSTDSETSRD